jgi:uncharacterized protein (TIGR03435 family)
MGAMPPQSGYYRTQMKLLAVVALACATSSVIAAQAARRLEFEVASVKLSPASEVFTILDRGGPGSSDPGTWSCEYNSLRDLISKAFALSDLQIAGPKWIANQRFHILAKLPSNTSLEEFRDMLRNLLIDRFGLVARVESRAMPRYELAVASTGHKLREPAELSDTKQTRAPKPPALDADGFPVIDPLSREPQILTIHGSTRLFLPRSTIGDLAEELSIQLGKPVLDLSSLNGQYDIGLYWNDDSGPNLNQALKDQLGLRLSEKKGPMDFLTVQHIEKLPAVN